MASFSLDEALLYAYATNNRINEFLIEGVPDEAWSAKPPGGKGRTIGAIASHMHNVRLMWLKAVGAKTMPAKLEPETATKADVIAALRESAEAIAAVLKASIEAGGKVKGFKPDVGSFFGYLIAHDAHHRGQIMLLAKQTGHPVSQKVGFGLWEWGTR